MEIRSEVSNMPIVGIPESWKKSYKWPEIEKGLKSGDIAIITKKGHQVVIETAHDCDCEHCDHTEIETYFFDKEKDAEKCLKDKTKFDDLILSQKIHKDIWIIKAVKQLPPDGGLFNG